MTRFSLIALASAAALFSPESEGGNGAANSETPVPTAPTALVPLTDEPAAALKKAMRSRQVFPTIADAVAKLQTVLAATNNAHGLPVEIVGMDSETGNVDESVYDGMNAALAYVGTKGSAKGDKESGVKGIVIFPVPPLSAFLESEAGKNWLAKIAEKEAALVAFRNFRDAATTADFAAGVAKTPKTVDEYVAEHARSGAGLDTETFDIVWPVFRALLKSRQPAIYKALPAKPEVIKAMRSSAYATAEYPQLESAGMFAKILQSCIKAAETNIDDKEQPAPLDSTAMASWLAGRDSLVLTKAQAREVDYDAAVAAFADWAN